MADEGKHPMDCVPLLRQGYIHLAAMTEVETNLVALVPIPEAQGILADTDQAIATLEKVIARLQSARREFLRRQRPDLVQLSVAATRGAVTA